VQEMLGHASILSTQVYTKLTISKGRRVVTSNVPATAGVAARMFLDPSTTRMPIKKK